MLRIVDYAKGKDIEWYEVIRQAINEAFAAPVVILTCGELRVYELDQVLFLIIYEKYFIIK